jgi:hypothetical protein
MTFMDEEAVQERDPDYLPDASAEATCRQVDWTQEDAAVWRAMVTCRPVLGCLDKEHA